MSIALVMAARFFDALSARWRAVKTQRSLGTAVALLFVGALVVIELNRQGLLPQPLRSALPVNHFRAIVFAFTLLLIIEVLGLVFTLARSVADSLGKQFEVLSLILLREAFLEFASFGQPLEWAAVSQSVLHMLSDTAGALLVFVAVGFYYQVQKHQPITADKMEQSSFVATKKLVGLILLAAFVALGANHIWQRLLGEEPYAFFEAFYVVLIFTDILIVLVSLRYSTSYRVVLRNSGFAAATVMIRLALSAPPYINAVLGLGSALFALGLSVAYNAFAPVLQEQENR